MRYRYFFLIAVVGFAAAGVLDHFHQFEENSPLVMGPALLGLAALVSPLILGWNAGEGIPVGGRRLLPSGRAVLQSVILPLAGAGLTVWGVLGATGVVKPVSFDGLRQHCRECDTTWILDGDRDGRPHFIDGCDHCTEAEGLLETAAELAADLRPRLEPDKLPPELKPPDGDRITISGEIPVRNRSPVGFRGSELEFGIQKHLEPVVQKGAHMYESLGLQVEIDGAPTGTADEYRLTFRLTLRTLDGDRAMITVERAKNVRIKRSRIPG